MRRHRGHALRRRYGKAYQGLERPFQVVYDHAGWRLGHGLTPTGRFGDANRAAIEMVRSGRTKRAVVVYTEPRKSGDSSPHKIQKLAEYVLGPGGGVQAVPLEG